MRSTDPLTDPAKVLLDRWPMTGQPGAGGSWPGGQTLGQIEGRGLAGRPARISRSVATAARSAWRDNDAGRVGHDRVQQLDLETDDRMDPDSLGRANETDRAIQTVMVRDGQPGQPKFDGSLDQVVGRGCPIEEREIGVAMEFGVRGLCHGSLRSESRWQGACHYRTSVLSWPPTVRVSPRTRFPSNRPKRTKQDDRGRRLTDMHAPVRQVAFSAIRVGAMVALAMLLILGLLPAILAVQAAST